MTQGALRWRCWSSNASEHPCPRFLSGAEGAPLSPQDVILLLGFSLPPGTAAKTRFLPAHLLCQTFRFTHLQPPKASWVQDSCKT
jgi:hypothetical protein